jgi:hypothetical protein
MCVPSQCHFHWVATPPPHKIHFFEHTEITHGFKSLFDRALVVAHLVKQILAKIYLEKRLTK